MTSGTGPQETSKLSIFKEEDLLCLDVSRIPAHIAIIPDGNRRWAKQRQMAPEMGHHRGADCLTDIVKAAKDMGVRVLTIFGFSTENHSRPNPEVEAVMFVIERYLIDKRQEMIENGIRCLSIGDTSSLPESVQKAMLDTAAATAHCQDVDFVLALNYGGRDDICRAVRGLAEDCQAGKLLPDQITEEAIARRLDTAQWPDPDMIIRTSGELRISNFLIWQASYSELCPVEVYWPDFSPIHLLKAVQSFQQRQRRHGS